jgi:hypothetical protein
MSRHTIFCMITLLATAFSEAQPMLNYKMNVYRPKEARGYYFLFTYLMKKKDKPPPGQQMIIDGSGHMVYYRITPKASDFKLHRDGRMSFFSGNKFYLMNSSFSIVDSISCVNGIETDPHDFQILPNGHYLLIGLDSVKTDLSAYHIFMQQALPGSKNATLKAGVVQELDRDKNLVFQWNARPFFHLDSIDRFFLNDTNVVDITHFNSVDKNRKGEILLSARYTHEVLKLSPDRKIVWRLGGPYNQFYFADDSVRFLGQHDARFAGRRAITLFDNGYAQDPYKHNARAVKYRILENKKSAKIIWSYSHQPQIVSEATGNAQWQSSGQVLINYGKVSSASPNITFEEVTSQRKKIVELSFEDTVGSYRAFHYKKLPFKLVQPSVKMITENHKLYLSAKRDYPAYRWPTGDAGKTIEVKEPGVYYLYVSVDHGGFLSSKPIFVSKKRAAP